MGRIIYLNSHKRNEVITMDKKRRLHIEQVVNDVIERNDLGASPYIDITSLVKKDGFDIQAHLMPIDTTGCIFVNDVEDSGEKERLIIVNRVFRNPESEEDVIFKKSRFITAHEYGHYILHIPEGQKLYAHRDSDKRDEPEEQEADFFARCILMPKKYFKAFYELGNEFGNDENFTIYILSKIFKVTQNKVRMRINEILE